MVAKWAYLEIVSCTSYSSRTRSAANKNFLSNPVAAAWQISFVCLIFFCGGGGASGENDISEEEKKSKSLPEMANFLFFLKTGVWGGVRRA